MQTNQLSSVFDQYARNVFRYSMFKLNNRTEAEDVTSETFARALESKKLLNEIQNQELWLIGIARNIIYEKYRRESKTQPITEEQIEEVSDASLEGEPLEAELMEQLQAALDTLDDSSREIVVLKVWENLKFSEIATLLDASEGQVKMRYYRAVKELQVELTKEGKKLRAVTLPIILAGIWQLRSQAEFQPLQSLLINLAKMAVTSVGSPTQLVGVNSQAPAKLTRNFMRKPLFKVAVLAAVSLGLVGVVAYIFISRLPVNNNCELDGCPEPETPVVVETPSPIAKGDLVFVLDGEVWAKSPAEGAVGLKLTETGGLVKNFILSKDNKVIVYSVATHERVQADVDKLPDTVTSGSTPIPVPKADLGTTFATQAYKYDLIAKTTELLVDYQGISVAESSLMSLVAGAPVALWNSNKLDLFGFSDDGSQIIFAQRQLKIMSLADKQAVTLDPSESDLCYTFHSVEFVDTSVLASQSCWESSIQSLYQKQGDSYQKFTPDFGNVIGESYTSYLGYVPGYGMLKAQGSFNESVASFNKYSQVSEADISTGESSEVFFTTVNETPSLFSYDNTYIYVWLTANTSRSLATLNVEIRLVKIDKATNEVTEVYKTQINPSATEAGTNIYGLDEPDCSGLECAMRISLVTEGSAGTKAYYLDSTGKFTLVEHLGNTDSKVYLAD